MGKPIAGEGQYPFTIGGILVNGVKFNGQNYVKSMYIHKQRSSDVYDLIDDLGKVYTFLRLVYRNSSNEILKYTDLDADITDSLQEGTFYIKEQDPSRGIFGFSTLYQYNKIKINTGDYIFKNPDEYDYSLLSVQVMPYSVIMNVGETKTFNIKSIPLDYKNLNGEWEIDNPCISSVSSNSSVDQFTIKAVSEGNAIIAFTPNANETLTSFAHIRVMSKPVEIKHLSIVYPYGGYDKAYAKGESFTVRIITEPLDARTELPYPDKITYNSEYLELTNVSDDNKYFTFKVISDKDAKPYDRYSGIRESVIFDHTIDGVKYKTYTFSDVGWFYIVTKSSDVKFTITSSKRYAMYGETIKLYANYDKNLYTLDPNEPITWEIEEPIGEDGTLNVINDFECDYTAPSTPQGWRHVGVRYKNRYYYMTVWFESRVFANSVRISPITINTMKPGESIQLTPIIDPPDYVLPHEPKWNYGIWGDIYPDFFDITSDGLLTVKSQIPRNIELRPNMYLPDVMYGNSEYIKYMALTIEDVKPLYVNVRQYQAQYILPLGQDIVVSISQYPTVNSYIQLEYEWDDPTFVTENRADNEYELSNFYSSLNTGAQLVFKPTRIGTHTITVWFKDLPEIRQSKTFTVFQPG